MKLDLTPEQDAWLREVLRRHAAGEPLAGDEVDALATYWNDDYVGWLSMRDADNKTLSQFEDAYLDAMETLVVDGSRGCATVVADRAPVRASPRSAAHSGRGSRRSNRVTIQRTDKRWKILDLVGALIVIGSVASCCATPSDPGGPMAWLCVGLVVWGVGRLGAWWTNG